jgi:hypothetical protein
MTKVTGTARSLPTYPRQGRDSSGVRSSEVERPDASKQVAGRATREAISGTASGSFRKAPSGTSMVLHPGQLSGLT